MEAPPPESPPDPEDSRADEQHRPSRPAARRALGRGLGSILSTAESSTAHGTPAGAAPAELESLLTQAREELARLHELEQQIEQTLARPDVDEQVPIVATSNGVLKELRLGGLQGFGQAIQIAERLRGHFAVRSYEQGTLRLAVIPARRLAEDDIEALASATGCERLRQESHDSFVIG